MNTLFTIMWQNCRAAGLGLLLALVALLLPNMARASHIRAGQIEAKVDTTSAHNPNRVFFKLTIYQNLVGTSADQGTAVLYFGDGTSQTANRTSGTGFQQVIRIPGVTDTGIDIFYFDHTYPGAKSYDVSFNGELRNAGILNFPNSGAQSFYIRTTITIDPALGVNHSPILRTPAIDKAGQNQVYVHNPGAYDADGDSLSFTLQPCEQAPSVGSNNTPAPTAIPGFVYPNQTTGNATAKQIAYNGVPAGQVNSASIFVQNPVTGQITWNTPLQVGLYNVAFIIEEWRRTTFGPRRIGIVRRDMQITVVATTNLRPVLKIPNDTCVVAGTTIGRTITAVDGTGPGSAAATAVTLTAYAGILPPATFVQTAKGPPTASGQFLWATTCSNVAKEPYSIVFKAQDTPPSSADAPLVDEQVWRVTVVGPPPQNLVATPVPGAVNQVNLTWDRYTCTNASFIRIYRKENTSTFVPGPCDTGIPASAGYTLVGSVAANLSSFKDDNNGAGLVRGKTYCYRIYADFPLPALGASIASAETCANFSGLAARIKNVDVDVTGTANGQITVRWTPARAALNQTLAAPAGYRLSRGVGLAPTTYTLVRTTAFVLTDSSFVDTGLNTTANQYTYKLDLFYASTTQPGATETVETSNTASSVRTTAVANGLAKTVAVAWTYQVPWDNTPKPALVFRSGSATGPFAQVGSVATTATGGTFTDTDPALVKGNTYCYYVQTTGQYSPTGYLSALINKSEIYCVTLLDQPCTPVLTLAPANCDSLAALPNFPANGQTYTNVLTWTAGTLPAGCTAAASYYRVFYRPTADGTLTLLDSTQALTYTHRNLAAPAGCYTVQAVNASGVRSAQSNVVCQNECVFFLLPNIFTPNGDGSNETFQPKTASPLRSVHFQAFNRWGVKVFENTTTARVFINWDGGGAPGETGTSGKVADGIYYYLAEVEFADSANTKRTYKGWVEIVR